MNKLVYFNPTLYVAYFTTNRFPPITQNGVLVAYYTDPVLSAEI